MAAQTKAQRENNLGCVPFSLLVVAWTRERDSLASNSVYVFVFFFLSSSSFIVVSYYYYYRRRNASCVLGRRWRYYYIFPPKTTSKEDFRSSRINPRTLLELLLLVPKYKRNARSLVSRLSLSCFLPPQFRRFVASWVYPLSFPHSSLSSPFINSSPCVWWRTTLSFCNTRRCGAVFQSVPSSVDP